MLFKCVLLVLAIRYEQLIRVRHGLLVGLIHHIKKVFTVCHHACLIKDGILLDFSHRKVNFLREGLLLMSDGLVYVNGFVALTYDIHYCVLALSLVATSWHNHRVSLSCLTHLVRVD